MKNNTLVKILIPIYKTDFSEHELKALSQCRKVLSKYPIVFVTPEHLDISEIQKNCPEIEIETFNDNYFKSIAGYNKLMLSTEFYERFINSHYILIYQLDSFVFRDELEEWCNKNYDYIGAPWLLKPKYHLFHMKLFLKIKSIFYFMINRPFRKLIVGDKIGNGGFSLRKVASHHKVTIDKNQRINFFVKQCEQYSEFNEDVFWATENAQFKYPSAQEALSFAIDQYPDLCYQVNNNKTPFGCHGWSKPSKFAFWKEKIYTVEKD